MKRPTLLDLSQLARDLAGLLRLGYPTVEAVQKVAPVQASPLPQILERSVARIHKGGTLSGALQAEPDILPLFTRMVEVAETSEELPQGLERAAFVMDELAARRTRCFLAALYPAIVFTMVMLLLWLTCVAGGSLLAGLFRSMNLTLPLTTRILIGLSSIAGHPLGALVFFALLVLLWVAVLGRAGWGLSMYRVPIFGSWLLRQEAVIYLKTVAHLVELGVPLVEATRMAVDACGAPLRDRLSSVSGRLESGDRLSVALASTRVLPRLAVWVIERREATEELRLLGVADLVDRELEVAMDRAMVLFEPLVFVGLLFAIGFFILSVFLPLYQLIGNLG